jgi:exodeoxyribonuclease VII small subunit
MNDEAQELTFEAALADLEAIVSQLEAGELGLEESIALFERGQQLADYCNKLLADATLRVEQLTADGEILDVSDEI